MTNHTTGTIYIGSKDWWLEQVESINNSSLHSVLKIVNDSSDQSFLYIARKSSHKYPKQGKSGEEKFLKDYFLRIGLFSKESVLLEESVKLGGHRKRIDAIVQGFDRSQWVIEFKMVEEKRVGEGKIPINIERMGASMGQTLLYCASYREKYPSQKWNIMPIVCTWSLGSGSFHIIELCKRVGITVINLDTQFYMPNGQALKIHYLDDDNPRLFLS